MSSCLSRILRLSLAHHPRISNNESPRDRLHTLNLGLIQAKPIIWHWIESYRLDRLSIIMSIAYCPTVRMVELARFRIPQIKRSTTPCQYVCRPHHAERRDKDMKNSEMQGNLRFFKCETPSPIAWILRHVPRSSCIGRNSMQRATTGRHHPSWRGFLSRQRPLP